MSIDLRTEQLISLAEAVRYLPRRSNGKRINVATVHRWVNDGCRGVRLEHTYVGAYRYTSLEALQRFLDARREAERSDGAESHGSRRSGATQADRAHDAVSRQLGLDLRP